MKNPLPLIIFLFLAGCAGTPQQPASSSSTQSSRYSIQQDRGPAGPIDVSAIREVVPIAEARTLAGNKSPYEVNGRTYRVMASEEGYRERGNASWYGEKFHGHLTSNGEVYDMYQLSAAHKSLPIPSFVKVTNLNNDRSLIVRVNDRGPFHSERIIDLSYAAAYQLGFADQGTAPVEVEAIIPDIGNLKDHPTQALNSGAGQYLQVGAFADRLAAENLMKKLRELTTNPVFIRSVQTDNTREQLHRVRVGPIASTAEARRISDLMVAADLGRPYTVPE